MKDDYLVLPSILCLALTCRSPDCIETQLITTNRTAPIELQQLVQLRLCLDVFKLRGPRLLSSLIVEDMGDQLTLDLVVRRRYADI